MKIVLVIWLVFISFVTERCKEKTAPLQFVSTNEISFGSPDSLLSPEKIDTSKLEPIYRQFESIENDPGTLSINKDRTFTLQFSGWVHQTLIGNWYLKNDTLNCYVTEDYCIHSFIANSNKFKTFKFILLNNNFYAVGHSRSKPYLCKKLYDHYIQSTHEN